MSQLSRPIASSARWRTTSDNEWAFRLGQLLMRTPVRGGGPLVPRTLELSPQFSKVYSLLGSSLNKLGRKDEAVKVFREGSAWPRSGGDNMPRDEMARFLVELGEQPPEPKQAAGPRRRGRLRCQRPGCPSGAHDHSFPSRVQRRAGRQIYDRVCADCWDYWLRNLSIKSSTKCAWT